MSRYRRRSHSIVQEPGFFLKHWWHGFAGWAVENKDQFITGVIAVLVIIAAGLLWRRHVQATEIRGWSEYGMADSVASLEAAVASYAGTSAGPFLQMKLADMRLARGEAAEAASAYAEAAERMEGPEKKRALFSRARALESAGRFDEAAAAYKSIAQGRGFWAGEAARVLDRLDANRDAHAKIEEMKAAAEAAARAEAAAETPAEGEETPAPDDEAVESETARPAGGPTESHLWFDQPEEPYEEP